MPADAIGAIGQYLRSFGKNREIKCKKINKCTDLIRSWGIGESPICGKKSGRKKTRRLKLKLSITNMECGKLLLRLLLQKRRSFAWADRIRGGAASWENSAI